MKTYASVEALESAIKAAAARAVMSESVLGEIKHEIAKQEQALVYGSYTPSFYWRRGSLGKQF